MGGDNSLNQSLFEICGAMGSSLELREVLDTILRLTLGTLGADAGSILLYEPGSEHLQMLASRGLPPNVVARGHISRKGSVAEWVIDHNQPAIVNKRSDIFPGQTDTLPETDAIKSAMCAPLLAKGRAIGALNVNRYQAAPGVFRDEDLRVLVILAGQAALCIENARLHEQIIQQARLAAIGQTVAGISHCVKNMLTGLRGGMGILEIAQTSKDWGTVSKATGFIKGNIERISMLVMDMLDYSREKTPYRKITDLQKLADEVFAVVHYKAEMLKIRLESEIDPACAAHPVDTDQIFRCLLNLVENAMDALEDGGLVRVQAAPVAEAEARAIFGKDAPLADMGRIVRLSVSDNGMGIPSENIPLLFQPFFSTKKSKGTGLGLAVTWKIVTEHGGKALVESQPGAGSSIHLILPEKNPGEADSGPTEGQAVGALG